MDTENDKIDANERELKSLKICSWWVLFRPNRIDEAHTNISNPESSKLQNERERETINI